MAAPHADLLSLRSEFPILEHTTYLINNSLGAMPRAVEDEMAAFTKSWGERGVRAWGEGWWEMGAETGDLLAPLLGVQPGAVSMHQNVSVAAAIFLSCIDYPAERNKIVYESLQFPTVSYVWQAEQRRGARCVVVPSPDGTTVDADAMCAAIDEQTLIVPISHVVFSSAFIQDVKKICDRARQVGAHVILDCYQSIGTLPIDVVDLGVSFACGGSVKYLCGGPGAAWLYVRKDLIEQFAPRVTGWFGNEAPFAFTMPEQSYAESIWRFMGGTPAVAALYQARAGHTIVGEIGVRRIREKSLVMTQRCIDWVDELGMKLNSPRAAERRGGSVVFDFESAADVCRELNRRKFFCDHRPGVGIRIAPHFYSKADEIDLFFAEVKKIRGGTGR